jgi:hypothetical protein
MRQGLFVAHQIGGVSGIFSLIDFSNAQVHISEVEVVVRVGGRFSLKIP